MPQYRVKAGAKFHTRDGHFPPGSIVELTEEQYKSHKASLEKPRQKKGEEEGKEE